MSDPAADIHILPIGDKGPQGQEHIESRRCWCEPLIKWPCDECVGGAPDCWNCAGTGWCPRGKTSSLAPVVSHEAQDGRE